VLLVAEMNASLEKLAHAEIGQCHDYQVSFTGSVLRGDAAFAAA
jgi:hypothetical protein